MNQRNVALITRGVSHNSTDKIHIHVSQIYYLMSPQPSSEVRVGANKSLARPGRKQATATKLEI